MSVNEYAAESIRHSLFDVHPSHLTALCVKALQEYLAEVDELRVEDLDVAGLAAQIAARLLYGWPTVDPDPTPPHGIERPAMVVYGLDSEPHPSAYLRIVR